MDSKRIDCLPTSATRGSADAVVYVVEDDPAVRNTLESLLRSVSLPMIGFESADAFLSSYDPSNPGCLVLDIRIPGMGGMELMEVLSSRGYRIPVIIVTGYPDTQLAMRALRAGAVDFIEKPFHSQNLLDCIRGALDLDQQRRHTDSERQKYRAMLATLTEKERMVMDLILEGGSSKQVAAHLHISRKTLDIHRARIFKKMQVMNTAELTKRVLIAMDLMHPNFTFLSSTTKTR